MFEKLKSLGKQLKREFAAYRLVLKHPQTPWVAKLFLGLAVGYLLLPFDLIPDFIPVLGYLDDLLIVPAGIWLAFRLIPAPVLQELRAIAQLRAKPVSRLGLALVLLVWVLLVVAAARSWAG